ncbi:MAG: efflux RND transporter periplasmic adaptor subunit, partial [Muribaculaceae bacterium]|nr:efflux RND transporter periplasmic adaptor subunit [Muribaculaceae bacterium]
DVYAYISLTEKDMLQLTENGKYTLNEKIKEMPEVTLRLSDGSIYPEPGKVSTVSGIIDNNTGSASVRVLFKNPNGLLRSGSTGQILMPVRLDSVIVIPQKATTELQDIRYAYVVNDSNVVTSVPITISPINDGKNFVVTSGLKPGQRIAVEGVGTKVRNGSVIQPVDPAQAAAAQQQAAQQQAAAGK